MRDWTRDAHAVILTPLHRAGETNLVSADRAAFQLLLMDAKALLAAESTCGAGGEPLRTSESVFHMCGMCSAGQLSAARNVPAGDCAALISIAAAKHHVVLLSLGI